MCNEFLKNINYCHSRAIGNLILDPRFREDDPVPLTKFGLCPVSNGTGYGAGTFDFLPVGRDARYG